MLDVEDREVEVIYDMRLVLTGDKVYVSDVDISQFGQAARSMDVVMYFYVVDDSNQLLG